MTKPPKHNSMNPWDRAPLVAETSEFAHQSALFMWANMVKRYGFGIANDPACWQLSFAEIEAKYHLQPIPQLKWLHAIKNQGHGDKVRGANSKAEGVKAGVLDTFLPVVQVPSYNCVRSSGLYLEMKRIGGKTSPEQDEFISDMKAEGYACAVCEGWFAASLEIIKYIEDCKL